MAEATFNSKDLEELAQNMYRTAEKLYPKEDKRFLQKEGNKGAGILRKKTRAATKKKTGNLIRGIKRGSVYQYKGSYQVRVKNNAPHAHLIEYGHVLWVNGTQTEKFVPGKYPLKKAAPEIAATLTGDVDGFVDDLISKGFGL